MASPDGKVAFEKLLNFRDVGLFINHTSSQNLLKPGLLFRGAKPDEATKPDRERLANDFKLKTVLDLRTETEHIEGMKKNVDPAVPSAPALVPKNVNKQLQVEGPTYININMNGDNYRKGMMKQLSYMQSAKLVGLFAVGKRKEAITILSKSVMEPRGVAGLAEDSLVHCQSEIKRIFDVIANKDSYPLLVHCTQGKDRTGLTMLLTLLLCGAPLNSIQKDYVLSETELLSEREENLKLIHSVGLPDEFVLCPPELPERLTKFINDKYGGIEAYLSKCGVTKEQQQSVKDILLA